MGCFSVLSRVKHRLSFMEKIAPPVNPNVITLLSLPLAFLSFYLMAVDLVIGGISVLFTAFFDALDGAVARKYGKVSRAGGYLDAVVDRYVETVIWVGVGWATGLWVLSMLNLAFSLIFSYLKARVALEVHVSNLDFPDLMERSERLLFLGLALLLSPFLYVGYSLALFFVLVTLGSVQRIVRGVSYLRDKG